MKKLLPFIKLAWYQRQADKAMDKYFAYMDSGDGYAADIYYGFFIKYDRKIEEILKEQKERKESK